MDEEYIKVPVQVEPEWEYESFETVRDAIAAANARGKVVYARVPTTRSIRFIHFEIHPNGDMMAHSGKNPQKPWQPRS